MNSLLLAKVENARVFLETILPPEGNGWYCAAIRKGKVWRHIPCKSVEELARTLLEQDEAGYECYHACATFSSDVPQGFRRAENVQSLKSFYFELDCHQSSQRFGDVHMAAQAVLELCGRTGLPRPLLVGSGNGLHCYLPTDTVLSREQWLEWSRPLKAFLLSHNLREQVGGEWCGVDPVVIADAARILRTPGTHNRKYGDPLPVRWEPRTEVYPLTSLGFLKSSRGGESIRRPKRLDGTIISRARHSSPSAYEASYLSLIVDQCGQVARLRASGSCSGWHLIVGVGAFCEDGPELIQKWSKNDYPEYSEDFVSRALARKKATTTGPTTCATFAGHLPEICRQCPHQGKVFTPMPLGHKKATNLPDVPPPFAWRKHDSALIHCFETNDGDFDEILICAFPFWLQGVQRGELNDLQTSFTFRLRLPHEKEREITIAARDLMGQGGVSEIIGRGAVIHDEPWFRRYCKIAADDFLRQQRSHSLYEQFGWKNDDFLYGTRLYTSTGIRVVPIHADLETRAKHLQPIGQHAPWKRAAEMPFRLGMEAQGAIVLCGAGAIFMPWQDQSEGGTIVHAWGKSGKGKTMAARVVWTMWSPLERWLEIKEDDTRISKPRAMGMIGNLPIIHDEFDYRDPIVSRQLVMQFTGGSDRVRATRTGGLTEQKADWHTIMISNANKSLGEYIDDGSPGGYAARMRTLDFYCTMPDDIRLMDGEQMKHDLEDNAGWAGHMMLTWLMMPDNLQWAKDQLKQLTAEIAAKLGNRPELRFRVRAIGCAALAGMILNSQKIIEHQTSRIIDWMIARAGSDRPVSSDLEQARDILSRFIGERMGEAVVVVSDKQTGRHLPPIRSPLNRVSMRFAKEDRKLWIVHDLLRVWCRENNLSCDETLRVLAETNVVAPKRVAKNLAAGTDLPGTMITAVEINMKHPMMSGMLEVIEGEAA